MSDDLSINLPPISSFGTVDPGSDYPRDCPVQKLWIVGEHRRYRTFCFVDLDILPLLHELDWYVSKESGILKGGRTLCVFYYLVDTDDKVSFSSSFGTRAVVPPGFRILKTYLPLGKVVACLKRKIQGGASHADLLPILQTPWALHAMTRDFPHIRFMNGNPFDCRFLNLDFSSSNTSSSSIHHLRGTRAVSRGAMLPHSIDDLVRMAADIARRSISNKLMTVQGPERVPGSVAVVVAPPMTTAAPVVIMSPEPLKAAEPEAPLPGPVDITMEQALQLAKKEAEENKIDFEAGLEAMARRMDAAAAAGPSPDDHLSAVEKARLDLARVESVEAEKKRLEEEENKKMESFFHGPIIDGPRPSSVAKTDDKKPTST